MRIISKFTSSPHEGRPLWVCLRLKMTILAFLCLFMARSWENRCCLDDVLLLPWGKNNGDNLQKMCLYKSTSLDPNLSAHAFFLFQTFYLSFCAQYIFSFLANFADNVYMLYTEEKALTISLSSFSFTSLLYQLR